MVPSHGAAMQIPGGNHLDRSRRLQPRDYVIGNPFAFGRDESAQFTVPEGGDRRWARVAELEHRLVLRWRQSGISGAEMARQWGCSRQTFSRVVLGERWAGELLLAALLLGPRRYDR